ncbi:hypothetical protein RJ641_021758 [Dillenia turbinata]|uniref:Outer envelope pore protein 37, chloroplastic n=1 Tax=Dillenia turbinata TaxID=194707 RepID=A0AAN8UPY5_9MAGN
MADPSSPNHTNLHTPPDQSLPPPDQSPPPTILTGDDSQQRWGLFPFPRPGLRVTTEFDSESSMFFHKISCKLLDSLLKFKLTFQNDHSGQISDPQLSLISKHLSVHFDPEENNALVKGSFDLSPSLSLRATHDLKEQQGEVAMIANLMDPDYKLELSSLVPSVGLPRATIRFPLGEISLEEKEEEEVKRTLSLNGIFKGQMLNGVCTAQYRDEVLNLRYCYKDEQMSFIPSITLPSNALSFAFKRRFSPSDKWSYWYNLDTNYWSTVYKHTVGKDLKFKAGYDSEVRLGWASLWIGDENGKAKTAPMKMKVQFMLQVPQDDIKSSALMFRVKKRWDI